MGTLTAALTAITAAITAALDPAIDVQEHPGRFTEEELGRIILKHRSVRVAIEDLPALTVDGTGLRGAEVQFTAVVICADRKGSDRHQAALNIVEALARLLPYQRWGQPEAFQALQPSEIVARNLYGGDIQGKGIAMWAVSWTQATRNT